MKKYLIIAHCLISLGLSAQLSIGPVVSSSVYHFQKFHGEHQFVYLYENEIALQPFNIGFSVGYRILQTKIFFKANVLLLSRDFDFNVGTRATMPYKNFKFSNKEQNLTVNYLFNKFSLGLGVNRFNYIHGALVYDDLVEESINNFDEYGIIVGGAYYFKNFELGLKYIYSLHHENRLFDLDFHPQVLSLNFGYNYQIPSIHFKKKKAECPTF